MKPIKIMLAAALAALFLTGCMATGGGQASHGFNSDDFPDPNLQPAPVAPNDQYDPNTGTVQPQ